MKFILQNTRFSILLFLLLTVFSFSLHAVDSLDSLPVKVVLFPFREAVLATQIEGTIISQEFRQGERFKKEDVLVKLDERKYRDELLKAEASVKEAELNIRFTEQKAQDNKRLYADGLQSDIEVKRSVFEADLAKIRLQGAMAALNDAKRNLAFCTVKAPFDGTVETLLARNFETVKGSQPILGIIDDTRLLAVMNLPTNKLASTRRGDKVTVRINETGGEVTGTVFEIAGRADHRSETFEIRVLLENRDHQMKAGMSGTLVKIGK
ncbi:MAG: efflux RND transporter periplasmic adaptor subunit [Lentisphaeria bacterium]|nr:efflux RND transporter periplasmic adaptor subunit [Lentisphaeria bacterium]